MTKKFNNFKQKKMAKRGRPKKIQSDNQAKTELQMLHTVRTTERHILYKDLANLRTGILSALQHVSDMDNSRELADAAFKAGRAYEHLNKASDQLEEMLESMYEANDFDHYDDLGDN
jgi:hypothetical protein